MRRDASTRPRGAGLLLPLWCLALAVLALGPALGPGYVLSYDMVFVPRLDLTRDVVGLGSGLPRAVPVDAVTALLAQVVPGDVLQKLVLVAALGLAGLGAARLTPSRSTAVRAVAATVYVWNPYVAERLVQGHWALLVAYAALPWVAACARDARRGGRGCQARLVALLGLCALTPTGGLLGALVAVAVLASAGPAGPAGPAGTAGPGRRVAAAVGAAALVNAPWWLPGLFHDGPAAPGAAGVEAFAPRGENLLGPLGALAGLGGIWNADVVPASRSTVLGVVGTVLLVGLGLAGASALVRRWDRGLLCGSSAAAVLGLVIAAAGVLPGARQVLAWLVETVPAAGLLRDGQKWVAPWALLLAPAAALGVERLAARASDPAMRALAAVGALVAVLAVLPDLGWGAAGRLAAVPYPAEWDRVRGVLAAEGPRGDVAVLPWATFRRFAWNGGRTVLDPAERYFPGSTVGADDLPVGGLVVPGDDPRSADVRAAFDRPDPGRALADLGIGWVLLEKSQPAESLPLPPGEVLHDGPQLLLLRLDGVPADRPLPAHAPVVLAADLAALAAVGAATVLGVVRTKSPRRRSPAATVPPLGIG